MKKENNYYSVVTKGGRYVKVITDNGWEGCESPNEAAYYTGDEANKVIKHLADKCYIYGATAVFMGSNIEVKQATKEAKQEGVKKSRRGTNIPKGSKWVVVDGKRKLVRPGEQAPISPISPKSPNDNTGNFDNLQGTAKDCEQLRTTANNCGELTWQDIKLIVRRADYILEKHSKKELLAMGEQEYYECVLEDYTALKRILK